MANFYSGSKGKLFVGDADEGISVAQDQANESYKIKIAPAQEAVKSNRGGRRRRD